MQIIHWLLFIAGTISLILGIIGIFVPLLPTTPFLLLTAYLYFRSSPKAYDWLIRQKHLGPYIINYREKKIIPLRIKVYSLVLMWGFVLYGTFFLIDPVWLKIVLLAIILAVSVHIGSFKSEENEDNENKP
jgi:Uncharacterized protein conserved in bacteria